MGRLTIQRACRNLVPLAGTSRIKAAAYPFMRKLFEAAHHVVSTPHRRTIVMTYENENHDNRVDRAANGAFLAFWHGRMAYENGRVKRFETEREAWEFLSRCDAAGKIVH